MEVARAIAAEPRLLLLDEPAAGLNESEQQDLAKRIRNIAATGVTVLVIEHNMPFLASLAERLVCLDHGLVIAEGSARRGAARSESDRSLSGDSRVNAATESIAGDILLAVEGLTVDYGHVRA